MIAGVVRDGDLVRRRDIGRLVQKAQATKEKVLIPAMAKLCGRTEIWQFVVSYNPRVGRDLRVLTPCTNAGCAS